MRRHAHCCILKYTTDEGARRTHDTGSNMPRSNTRSCHYGVLLVDLHINGTQHRRTAHTKRMVSTKAVQYDRLHDRLDEIHHGTPRSVISKVDRLRHSTTTKIGYELCHGIVTIEPRLPTFSERLLSTRCINVNIIHASNADPSPSSSTTPHHTTPHSCVKRLHLQSAIELLEHRSRGPVVVILSNAPYGTYSETQMVKKNRREPTSCSFHGLSSFS